MCSLDNMLLGLITVLFFCLGKGSLLSISPNIQAIRAPQSASIVCTHTSSCSAPQWTGPAVDSGRERVTTSVNGFHHQSKLTITNLVKSDQGEYSCVCGSESRFSTLDVLLDPHFNVTSPQRFTLSTNAHVICEAFPGDPPQPFLWWSPDGNRIHNSEKYTLQNNTNTLVIRGFENGDVGDYECGFQPSSGIIRTDITVAVGTQPPVVIEPEGSPEGEVHVRYNDSLRLNCSFEGPHESIMWIYYHNGHRRSISNNSLVLSPQSFTAGTYTCQVITENGRPQNSVYVAIDTPPILSHVPTPPPLHEGDGVVILINWRYPVENNHLNLQWTRQGAGAVDFGSRLMVWYPSDSPRLELIIETLTVSDSGIYQLNISNEFGSEIINIRLKVTAIPTVQLELTVPDQSCDWIKENREEIGRELVNFFEQEILLDVMVVSNEVVCSGGDRGTLRMVLKSAEDIKAYSTATLRVAGVDINARICYDCSSTTSPTPPKQVATDVTPILVPVVAVVAVVVCVLAVVLALTYLLKKTGHYCGNHRVTQESGNTSSDTASNNTNTTEELPEVVIHKDSPGRTYTFSPIPHQHQQYQQQHQQQQQQQANGGLPSQTSTQHHSRQDINRFFTRSLSYSGATRTWN